MNVNFWGMHESYTKSEGKRGPLIRRSAFFKSSIGVFGKTRFVW